MHISLKQLSSVIAKPLKMEGAQNLKLFQEIWNIFLKIDFVAGSFVLRQETSKLNWKEHLMKLNIMALPILSITLLFGTIQQSSRINYSVGNVCIYLHNILRYVDNGFKSKRNSNTCCLV